MIREITLRDLVNGIFGAILFFVYYVGIVYLFG